jgi:hypothetical protein
MKVFRVQDKHGRGPWKPGFSHTWVEDRDDHLNLPPWPVEFGGFENVLRKSAKGMHLGCGCISVEQLKRWFTFSEYLKLISLGYSAVEVEADNILAQSDVQCVFNRRMPLNFGASPVNLYSHVAAAQGVNPLLAQAHNP